MKRSVENLPQVLVLGAGISGLTAARALQDEGVSVKIFAKDIPPYNNSGPDIASPHAGALVHPAYADHPHMSKWIRDTVGKLQAQSAAIGADVTGIRMRMVTELLKERQDDPPWAHAVEWYGHSKDLPMGYKDGYRFRAPVVDMPVYLQYLAKEFESHGGVMEEGEAYSLSSLFNRVQEGGVVVNAAGLHARELVPDPQMHPARGQILEVSQKKFPTEEVILAHPQQDKDATYIFPQDDRVILGGTFDPGNEDGRVSELDTASILRRIVNIAPQFRGITLSDIDNIHVGFRPMRGTVRVENEGRLIHVYGHGGSGLTLSWGVAQDVVSKYKSIVAS